MKSLGLFLVFRSIVCFRDELLADPRPLYRGDEQVKVIPKKRFTIERFIGRLADILYILERLLLQIKIIIGQ